MTVFQSSSQMGPDTFHTQPAVFCQERDLQTPKYAKQQPNVTARSFYISFGCHQGCFCDTDECGAHSGQPFVIILDAEKKEGLFIADAFSISTIFLFFIVVSRETSE